MQWAFRGVFETAIFETLQGIGVRAISEIARFNSPSTRKPRLTRDGVFAKLEILQRPQPLPREDQLAGLRESVVRFGVALPPGGGPAISFRWLASAGPPPES